jgi:hypothetical protein
MKIITKNLQWGIFVFLVFQVNASAQIKIGDNPTVINSSAILEIESANKGFLLPRLQLTNTSLAAPLSQHVAGMIVYNTATSNDLTLGCYYNDGTKWIAISASTATGLLSANNGLTNINGVVKLGGSLIQPTVLSTTDVNTIAIKGLGVGDTVQGDFMVIDKLTGELKTIPYSIIENIINRKVDGNPTIIAGTKTKITYDEKGLVIKGEDVGMGDIQGLQNELSKKAPLESPVFTGTPKTAFINGSSSTDAIANKSYVDDAVTVGKTSVVSQTITNGETITAPSENAVYDGLTLKAPIDSPTFTGTARAVTPTVTSDNKTITTKEYVDAVVAQVKTDVVSQSILLNNTTTAPSEDVVREELDLKSPINSPVFTGIAKVSDITANSITDPLAIPNKGYVDSQITTAGNIYSKDGTLTDNRKVTLDGKKLDFIGSTVDNPTRLAPDGTMTVGGSVNINKKVAGANTPINAVQFTNDENGVGYSAASITAQTGDDKGKGQLSLKVKTATGVDTEAVRITDNGNVLIGGTTDDNTAVLNVQSTTKGILTPRQTKAQRDLISTPATGLQVYQTNTSGNSLEGQYLKTSTGWRRILLEGEIKQDYYEAINTSGVTISGSTAVPVAVHITGVDGSNNKNIKISDAATSATALFDGVIIDNVAAGALCKVYLRYASVNSNTSTFAPNASLFLSTGGSFTNDPSSLPFGVNVGKVLNVSPTNGAVLFSIYPAADFFRNQYERIKGVTDETVFTGRLVSSLEPLDDTYLTNKKYVDETVAFAQLYQGAWNAATNLPPLVGAPTAKKGWAYDVTVASGGVVNYTYMCTGTNILKGDVIKFDGTCWVVLEKQYPSATTTQEGMVKLDAIISASTTLVPTSSLLKQVSDVNQSHIANTSNPHNVTKVQVGLGNADDTSDANKPVSGPQQTALNLKADKTNGASQITDSNPYGNIGTLAGVTQAAINAGINTKLGEKTQLNGTGLVRMAGTAVIYDNTAYAPLASPVFTGDAQAVEPSIIDNDTSIATTSFVNKTSFGLWSKTGNVVDENLNFIGTTNNEDLVFKAFNIERMRLNYSLGQVDIGTTSSPTKLQIKTTSELSKNIPLSIVTNDISPLSMTVEAFGAGVGSKYFNIRSYTYDYTNFLYIPANLSFVSDGGIISIGKNDFTGLSEKLEVNGNVRATGFKIPSGTSSQFLMADGSTSTGPSSNDWSLTGNSITTSNFIGSTNNQNLIFKTNNIEQMRLNSNTGRLYVGNTIDPNSSGSLHIITNGGTTTSIPLTIQTADFVNPLVMLFQANVSAGSKYFKISNYIGDTSNPANLALMPEGGMLNLGYFDFTGLSEKLEVNGKVRATGFKVPTGTASQYLMADGSVSSLTSNGWALIGNAGTIPGTNFIGTTDNKDLVFKANNIERMRVNNANGKLSIGDNTNPGSLLITTSSSASTAPFSIATSDANPLVMTVQDLGFAPNNFFSVDAFRVGSPNTPANIGYLSSGGLFSIGYNDYTGLTEKVEVNGKVRATGFKVPNGTASQYLMADGSTSTGSTTAGWSLIGNSVSTTDFIGTTNAADIIFKGNNKERWRMGTDTGTLYVGDIIDPESSGTLMIVTNTASASSTPFIIKTADASSPLVMTIETVKEGGKPFFKLGTKGEFTEAVDLSFMPDGGMLNIGSDNGLNLETKVDVKGFVRATGFISPGGSSLQYLKADGSISPLTGAWELAGNTGINPAVDFIGTRDNNPLVFKTNNAQRFLVAPDGGVFVNENAIPGYQFHVNGTVGGSQPWAVLSDKRLKTNIQPVENGLSSVMQMKPVAYDKKASLASKDYNIPEIGFIAQDLKLLFQKGVVNEGQDKDKLLSVNYTELIPVLTKAIQEQQKIIDEEKAKNDTQQKEIDELKAMVKQLMEKK